MQSNCEIIGMTRDLMSNKICVTLKLDNGSLAELNELSKRDDLDVTIARAKRKRSLDANAYFHVLNGLLADKLSISKIRCKNLLLGRYGQREAQTDGNLITLLVRCDIDMMERDDIHTECIGYQFSGATQYNKYVVIKPSHLYSRAEMAALIAGTVEECEAQGINTMTPDQIARLTSVWKA